MCLQFINVYYHIEFPIQCELFDIFTLGDHLGSFKFENITNNAPMISFIDVAWCKYAHIFFSKSGNIGS